VRGYGTAGQTLGYDLAFIGDVTNKVGDVVGDPTNDIAIGENALIDPGSGLRTGGIVLFAGSASLMGIYTLADADAIIYGPSADSDSNVGTGGDLNGDGIADLVLDAPDHNGVETGSGAAYALTPIACLTFTNIEA
jgi:hypothetical protein